MVGDWVEFETMTSNFLYGKVEGINKNYITIETINAIEDVPIEKVGKIVVTPDMLRKNGFEKYSAGYYRNSTDLHLQPDEYGNWWCVYDNHEAYMKGDYIATFTSVHELQNILRVMGYNDLANWFRI